VDIIWQYFFLVVVLLYDMNGMKEEGI